MNPLNLDVFNMAQELAVQINISLKGLPIYYVPKRQVIASSSSVFANLTEFCAVENDNQKLNKLYICIGENLETSSWIDYLTKTGDLNKDKGAEFIQANTIIRKKLYVLKKSIEENKTAPMATKKTKSYKPSSKKD